LPPAIAPFGLEDPVPTDKIEDFQGLRDSSPVPFAGREPLYTQAEVAPCPVANHLHEYA